MSDPVIEDIQKRLTTVENEIRELKKILKDARILWEGDSMTDLPTHIHIFKELRFPNKNAIIRMLWHFIEDHRTEITLEEFIKAISWATTTTNAVKSLRKE